ncbi:hypothetical protein RJ55_07052 [Drechmeria coniospora]|nr:hypothetical protein RJ55_07052 [Drechmeria coniospora]
MHASGAVPHHQSNPSARLRAGEQAADTAAQLACARTAWPSNRDRHPRVPKTRPPKGSSLTLCQHHPPHNSPHPLVDTLPRRHPSSAFFPLLFHATQPDRGSKLAGRNRKDTSRSQPISSTKSTKTTDTKAETNANTASSSKTVVGKTHQTRPTAKETHDVSEATATMSPKSEATYYLLPDLCALDTSARELELDAHAWVQPTIIDDDDLTFGGKPLSAWYEEERSRLSSSAASSDDDQCEERRGRERTRRHRKDGSAKSYHHHHHHHSHHGHDQK